MSMPYRNWHSVSGAMPSICMVVTTDGRADYISQAIPTWETHVSGNIVSHVIVDDSGDVEYRTWLDSTFGDRWTVVPNGEARLGYSAAMQKMRAVGIDSGADYILHVEDDFLLNDGLDVDDICGVLDDRRYLAQIALLRQPWYANEIRFGGVIPALEEQGQHFTEATNGVHHWIEHRAVWTANPNVFSTQVASIPYPTCNYSEAAFMAMLREQTGYRCAYWGRLSDAPRVTHIGEQRVGIEY